MDDKNPFLNRVEAEPQVRLAYFASVRYLGGLCNLARESAST